MDIITIHFQEQVGHDLNKLIYLISLFFFISGCGGTLRPATVPSNSLVPNQDDKLASIRIPDPPDILVPGSGTDSDSQALVQPKAIMGLSFEIDQWSPGEGYPLFALTGDEERGGFEPVSAQTAENLVSEPHKNFFLEKRPSAPSKITKATTNPLRHGLSPHEGGMKKGEDKPSLEDFQDPLPVEALSSSQNDQQEVGNRFQDLFGQMDGKPFVSDSPEEGVTELPSSANRSASFGSAVTTFPSLVNEKVKGFISFFQGKADSFFSRSLARSQAYEEMMKKIFREKNLPEELFYLALIESGYNPTALSRAKASGIWQFVAQTAKRYGLRVDKWVDERRDPEKSTHAAAEYLKTLHGMFNSWDLAAAGYNAGEGKVLKAMKIARSDDFWEISKYRFLKQETKKYVPMFLAAVTIAKEPQKYGFDNIAYHPPLVYEKVTVPPSTSFASIAKAAETDLSEIRSLNPALIREKTPPNSPSFDIKLPMGKKDVFERNFPRLSHPSGKNSQHRVCSGETLARVAKKYQVSLQDLCSANEISPQTTIKPGSILKIPQ